MSRYIILILLSSLINTSVTAQKLITRTESIDLAVDNQQNLKARNLAITQQQQLVSGAAAFDNPQIQVQASPYEPLVIGAQQSFNLPAVYRNRKALQNERVALAKLQLSGAQIDLKRAVSISYFRLQYFSERIRLLMYQDSIYQAIKIASKRFFDAGQINKLEELQATSQADRVHNEVERARIDLISEKQLFGFYTNFSDSFSVEPIQVYLFNPPADTLQNTIQKQILQQQASIRNREFTLEKAEILPSFTAGILFPTTKNYERPIGYQVGVAVPVWTKQNRSRIAAAGTAVEIARAQQELAVQQLNTQYQQALNTYRKEQQSLSYFNETALPQARAIIETSQRLFQGGELNYIESLRNLQLAFQIINDHLETHRASNQAVIELNYLQQTL